MYILTINMHIYDQCSIYVYSTASTVDKLSFSSMTQLHRLNPLDHDRSGLQGSSAGWKTCHYDDHHRCYSMWCWIWCLVGYLNININITLNIAISYFLRYFSEEDDEDDLIGLWIDSSLMAWKNSCKERWEFPVQLIIQPSPCKGSGPALNRFDIYLRYTSAFWMQICKASADICWSGILSGLINYP